jgi:hypothetical protein
MKLFNMTFPMFDERGGTNMQSIEVANVYNICLQKEEEDNAHEHSRISIVPVVTASMCCVVSKYLCVPVPISTSKVGLIGKSLMWPLVAATPCHITEWSLLL